MRKHIFIVLIAIGHLCAHAQVLDIIDTKLFSSRVKLVSEFMERFNGEERNPYIDPSTTEIEKINLCRLFDAVFILKNRAELEPKVFQFVDSVLQNKVKINYSDPDWFATTTCVGKFKGKELKFDLILTVEPRGKDMYKWVIADVKGDIFNLKPSRDSEKIMLLPNEHESNFMRLNSITNEIDNYIPLYSSKVSVVDRLTVFNTLVYYNFLNIEYVSDIEYTFLQVPGYLFTIKEFERETANSGWLIQSWSEVSDDEKNTLLNQLYHGKYSNCMVRKDGRQEAKLSQTEEYQRACKMVSNFVSLLNTYASAKDSKILSELNTMLKGRYTFIITDEISKQLAKHFKCKPQKSYKLKALTDWLGHKDSPVKSIAVANVQPFESKYIKPEYSKGYTLVSGDLSADGDLKVNEQVVFFIYENQIAGIKLVSDCF